jgi:xanthine dehydrogenase accessory factor
MSRPMDVYEELVHLRRTGQKAALATIIEVAGSIPSFQSAKMLVREDGSMVGTIGGGCTEAEVWNAAREVMATEKPKMLNFNLGQDAAYDQGLICGGQLNVYVEPVLPIPSCFIFGAGHISKSLSKIATQAGFRTVIVDNRDNYANRERFPEAAEVFAGEYEEVFPKLAVNDSSYCIIVTRGHKDDMRILRWVVTQPVRYLGMIGSKRKTIEVVKHLRREGVPLEKFAQLHAPMGFEIGAVTPEEIAVSVVAEMIQRRRNPVAGWNPLSKSIFAEGIPKAVQIEPLAVETRGDSGDAAAQTTSSKKAASSSAE